MKISVIIPNWNGKNFLEKCLVSLEGQTFKDFEIIIIDNGSNDGSVEFVKKEYPKIIIECFEENKGFVKAVNRGIEIAKGGVYFFA